MLFSQSELAGFLTENFECAWESLRPVPRIDIDFGNGYRLQRTLKGNIATWLCTPEGLALDVIPGLMGPKAFRSRVQAFLDTWRGNGAPGAAADANVLRSRFTRFHQEALVRANDAKTNELPPVVPDTRKLVVEDPILVALREPDAFLKNDTQYNELERDAPTRRLMLQALLQPPAQYTVGLFATVLDVNLHDPFLGLAPYVLGGEGGRTPDPSALMRQLTTQDE